MFPFFSSGYLKVLDPYAEFSWNAFPLDPPKGLLPHVGLTQA